MLRDGCPDHAVLAWASLPAVSGSDRTSHKAQGTMRCRRLTGLKELLQCWLQFAARNGYQVHSAEEDRLK